jgi:hypothetical protein
MHWTPNEFNLKKRWGQEYFKLPLSPWNDMPLCNYLDFSGASFAVLLGTVVLTAFCFSGRQPQPQDFFCSAIIITSF